MSVKQDISRLRKNRFIHFQVGLILSICFVLFAFSWTSERSEYTFPIEELDFVEIEEDKKIIRTEHKKPPPPKKEILNQREIEAVDELPTEEIIKEDPKPEVVEVPIGATVVAPTTEPVKPVVQTPPTPVELPDEQEAQTPDIIHDFVSHMPMFPGCDDEDYSVRKACAEKEMLSFIYKNISYPVIARENGIEGLTVIQFVVNKDGSISNLKPLKQLGGGCTKEAMRVIEKMPKWLPGYQKSNPVKVYFKLPVKFALEKQ